MGNTSGAQFEVFKTMVEDVGQVAQPAFFRKKCARRALLVASTWRTAVLAGVCFGLIDIPARIAHAP